MQVLERLLRSLTAISDKNTSDYGVAALYNTYGGVMKVGNSAVVENRIESYVRTNTSARGVSLNYSKW